MSTIVERVRQSVKINTGDNRHLRPMVTFSFDDGYDSDYNIVFPIFKELGFRGTFFVLGSEDRLSSPGMTSGSQYKEMADSGQEIGCHGQAHLSYFSEPDNNVIREDMLASKKVLEGHIKRPVLTHAYPFGGDSGASGDNPATLADALRVQNIAGGIYEAARGTTIHVAEVPYDNPMDRLMLYGDKNIYNVPCRLSDSGWNKNQIINIVDNMVTMEEPAWQNFAFHRIYADGDPSKPDNRMYESEFRAIMEHVAELKEQKLIDVVPFYEGARRIRTGISTKLS